MITEEDYSLFDDKEWEQESKKLVDLKITESKKETVVAAESSQGPGIVDTTPSGPSPTPVVSRVTERSVTTTTTTTSPATTVKPVSERPCICRMPSLPKGECEKQLTRCNSHLEATLIVNRVRKNKNIFIISLNLI